MGRVWSNEMMISSFQAHKGVLRGLVALLRPRHGVPEGLYPPLTVPVCLRQSGSTLWISRVVRAGQRKTGQD